MCDREKKEEREQDRRKDARFAWLGPLLERRKTPVEPVEEDEGKEEGG